MRIEDLRKESTGYRTRAAATIIWEDSDRPTREVFYETDAQFGDDLHAEPDGFVVGAVIPALEFGEKRLRIEGSVCAALHDNLHNVMALRRQWFGTEAGSISIEPTDGFAAGLPRHPPRAASFLSGGVDSTATLRRNRMIYPADHDDAIKDCLFVYGFDLGGLEELAHHAPLYERARQVVQRITDDAGATLIPVYTNVRHLEQNVEFWMHKYFASAITSVAHMFRRRLTRVSLAASQSFTGLIPWGSHPLLDPNYSSAAVRLCEDGTRLERIEKMRIVADWPAGLANLRVCWNRQMPDGLVNCGTCGKCVRTKLELMALGKLAGARSMPGDDVTPNMVARVHMAADQQAKHFQEIVEPLAARGHGDLVRAIHRRIVAYEAEKKETNGGRAGKSLFNWRSRMTRWAGTPREPERL